MASWLPMALAAAALYGLHQIFTRLASQHISAGLGGFVVEAAAALTILGYLGFLWTSGRWDERVSFEGVAWSLATGICVGAGTVAFFLLFQRGGPLSAVPAILAAGASLMAVAGFAFFGETASWQRVLGVAFAIAGMLLLGS